MIARIVKQRGFKLLGVRLLPTDNKELGQSALATEPYVLQVKNALCLFVFVLGFGLVCGDYCGAAMREGVHAGSSQSQSQSPVHPLNQHTIYPHPTHTRCSWRQAGSRRRSRSGTSTARCSACASSSRRRRCVVAWFFFGVDRL